MACAHVAAADSLSFTAQDRIVNLGDSITDGQTYALLTQAALAEAGKPVPTFIGAGIGGDVASGMLKRLDRDVLIYHPTWVMLSCGVNEVNHGVEMADFETTVNAIVARLKTENVSLMILTTTNRRGGAQAQGLEGVKAILHRVADEHRLPIAEVYDRMEEARKKGLDLWEEDGRHLNFEGYRVMTRAVLDAMGHSQIPVPATLRCDSLPGIIRAWKILTVDEREPPMDEARAAVLKPDTRWKDFTLPEEKPQKGWWNEQERSRGFALSLNELFGGARHVALAEVKSEARKAYINTGGYFKTVWLNGKNLLVEPHGWHAGNNRIPVELQSGMNTIIIETGGNFFLSITDTNTW